MRGFAGGVVTGLGLGVAALAGLSLVGSPRVATVSEVPGPVPQEGAAPESVEAEVPQAPGVAQVEGEANSEVAGLPNASLPAVASEPEPAPLVGAAAPEPIAEPDSPAPEPEVGAATEATSPAAPGAPAVALPDGAPETGPTAPASVEASDPVAAPAIADARDATSEPAAEPAPVAVAEPASQPEPTAEAEPVVVALSEGAVLARPDPAGEAPTAPAAEGAPSPEPVPSLSDPPAAPEAAPILAEAVRPARVRLEGSAMPGADAVRVNRPGAEALAEVVEPAPAEDLSADAPALRRYAAAFEPPGEARPLMSVVLLDDGATDPEAVAGLPWPVSVALDGSAPGAAERLAAWRAAGIEALVLARLPEGAQPGEAEAVLGAALSALPETVALLDLGEGGFAGRGAVAETALSLAARDGRGVVLGAGGLRSGLALAESWGVPSAELLRDLDGEGQDGAAIRRALDDAVLRAGQEGGAVVLGRMRPETLAALAEWSGERRAQEVTLAPVSAVLDAP